ncbi:MAG: DUF2911 domain-containing protein [Bacteroidetes bacterium]|nr:DUF2911 domain-containing protein [Bacteroidota bacterium]
MKQILLPVAALALCLTTNAQDLPQASPSGEVEQVVGLTKVEVDYSRPSVRDRRIFGELLPYDKVWRLGANANTTFEVSGPVEIEGQKLDKGKYSMFAIPHEGVWEIIFNKNTELWGENGRKEAEDVLRVKAKAEPCEFTETLTITFDDVKDDKARLDIRWEKTRVLLTLSADATKQGMENIKAAMAKKDIKAGSYASSARFAVERGVMTKDALTWAQRAVDMDPRYYYMYTLALAQAANGQTKEALATAQKSMEAAKKADDMAYVKLNEAKIKEWGGK